MTSEFLIFAQLPACIRNPTSAIAACRAGGIGVINAELEPDAKRIEDELRMVEEHVHGPFGLSADVVGDELATSLRRFATRGLKWLLVDPAVLKDRGPLLADLRNIGVRVLVRITSAHGPDVVDEQSVDGIVLKGHESGGFVGEDSTFVLLQNWRRSTKAPLYVHGGLTPQVAAACSALGVRGGVVDSQLLLLDDVRPSPEAKRLFSRLAGSETVAVGSGEHGEYFRVLVRPGHEVARSFVAQGERGRFGELRRLCADKIDWQDLRAGLLPVGQDICFAATWQARYRSQAGVFAAIHKAVRESLPAAVAHHAIAADAPLGRALKTRFPIVQGPMTRVSDRAEFADAVASAGGLPMVALALLKGESLEHVLVSSSRALGDRPWGIGLLGFAPKALLDEQLAVALRVAPHYAIIAGGRPDQAVELEKAGIPSFLHVPAAALMSPFLRGGARRFIFEGRECGGHVGPLSSFVLWSTMVATLVDELESGSEVSGRELQVLFAGGIHDAASSAMVQVLAAPLLAKGVNVGILMGSAYLFTRQIVDSGAIVPRFQQEVLACERTVTLASGPGHASRCAYTPFAKEFFRARDELDERGVPADQGRSVLDDLIVGRLRIASKGTERDGDSGRLQEVDEAQQQAKGMYMLGQVATLRSEITDIEALHDEVTEGAAALLRESLQRLDSEPVRSHAKSVDVAIVGIGSLFPGANSTDEYWDNILQGVHSITEIPRHRWDWRLYFDEDRKAKDKIYSKWGGFLDDLVFDPTRFGMPPRSVSAVDPMQLIALDVAHRTLVDAGYADRSFDHGRTSIVIGASGGTGDVGTQYCLRSELPRFVGELSDSVAEQLPEWTEDSFAGILSNVIAGRIANRLDFGGVNCTIDAACASSLASVYQGVHELAEGRADMVIAGGVDTVQGPFGYLCFSQTQALSPRGRCATFDAAGDGIVISEGVAMVALKRLADAERDGDRIYAVIKGVAGSSDGRARGMTAPVPAGQLRAMRRAYEEAGFGPQTVGLFEAHGTGTVAGDIAELKSTTQLVRDSGGRPHQAVIGSVKTMIGHTKATAGMAGIIKVALALHRRVLPPHRGVELPNPVLQRDNCPLHLLDKPRPWLSTPEAPRRAAVSAFGFGGTNFHVVLQEHTQEYRPWLRPAPARRWPAELLVWSSADTAELVAKLDRLAAELAADKPVVLGDLAAALAERFSPSVETLAMVVRDRDSLVSTVSRTVAVLRGESDDLPSGVYRSRRAQGEPVGKVAVLFSGQGSQYPDMLRDLMVHFPVCAETIAAADEALREQFEARFGEGQTLGRFVLPPACYSAQDKKLAAAALTSTDVAQPALGAADATALHLMRSLGLAPDMLGGHSFGEFVALYAGGAIDFESMLSLSAARGRAIVDAAEQSGVELGTMAAVFASRELVDAAISTIDDVVIANHNMPQQVVISGSRVAVAEATRRLVDQGVRVSQFPVAAGFHSPQVRPAQQALATAIEATTWSPPTIPVYSNTTARPHGIDVGEIQRVMAEHLVRPVEFVAQIEGMYEDGARTFVELGPKSVQSRLVAHILGDRPHLAVSIDGTPGLGGFLDTVAKLLCAGVELRLSPLFDSRATPVADPYSLPDAPVVPKHAWLINGSGARPAGTPPQQTGLTYEQVQAAAESKAKAESVVSPELTVPLPAATAEPLLNVSERPHLRAVPTRARPPAQVARVSPSPLTSFAGTRGSTVPTMTDHDQSTMNGYFNMMRQFLETQERVMSAYVSASSGVQPQRRLPPERVLSPAAGGRSMPLPTRPASTPPPRRDLAAAAAVEPVAPPVAANGHARVLNGAPASVAGANGARSAPTPAAAPAAPTVSEVATATPLDRAALADLLLGVVEDKTGYPRDMVKLDQNLEADLGIDSIKRIEVASAMLELLPPSHRAALKPSLGELNTQSTLDGMLGIIGSVTADTKEAAVPFDNAEAGVVANVGHPLRYSIVAKERPIPAAATRRITSGRFIVVDDALGVASELEPLLVKLGCTVTRLSGEERADEATLLRWIGEQSVEASALAGIIDLASLGAEPLATSASVKEWRQHLWLHEKSLFVLLRELNGALFDDGHVLAVSALGGSFGRLGCLNTDGFVLQGGAVGLLKSQHEERPTLRVKAVDIDPTLGASTVAQQLLDELCLVGGRIEVGYPGGRRTAFHTVAAEASVTSRREPARGERVVIATGGGRGVTAELLRELAVSGTTLILTGRRPLADDAVVGDAVSAAELRARFIAEVRSGASQLSMAQIGRQVQSTLATQELRQNIEDLRSRGATVEYHAVDVTDETALSELVADVQTRCGPIRGIVHGAGVIEDKLIVDKASESWSRVVETKVIGLLLLHRLVPLETLEFLAVMSSVAGRYGNSGQADYATANELMNRVCCQVQAQTAGAVNVVALCWGPWGPTKFGQGMVGAGVEAKFAAKGVGLVSAADGRKLFGDELRREGVASVEVICGAGPWEQTEAAIGAIESGHPSGDGGPDYGPLLDGATVEVQPKGARIVSVRLDPRHAYLNDHRIDGIPVLPAAVAVELFAEAASRLWAGWKVVEVRDCQLLKGVDLPGSERTLHIEVSPAPHGSSEGFEVDASLRSSAEGGGLARAHYRCVIRLQQEYGDAVAMVPSVHSERQLDAAKAYEDCLFHGPRFQVMTRIDGMSHTGGQAVVCSSEPVAWLPLASPGSRWVFDPALLDAGPQMAIVWARTFNDHTVLPARFGRVVRYRDVLPPRMRMVFECMPSRNASEVRGNVYYLDDDNEVVLLVEDLEGIGSSALNRLASRPTMATTVSLGTI